MFEFLVAIAVFGLMLLTVALGFRASERAVKAADKGKDARVTARAAMPPTPV